MRDHTKGLLIAFFGVLILSPDSLLIRSINLPSWDLLFWRGVITFFGLYLLTFLFFGRDVHNKYRELGAAGVLVSCCFAVSTICFVSAILLTDVANALVIVATSPVFAALLSRLYLNEVVSWVTWAAIIIVLIAIIFLLGDSWQSGNTLGDFCALVSAFFLAFTFVMSRKFRHIDMLPAMSISGVIISAVSMFFVSSFSLSINNIMLLFLLSFVIIFAYASFVISPRYISAPEVSMMLPLETVLGTVLVWGVLGERPDNVAMVSGLVVIVTLSLHSWYKVRQAKGYELSKAVALKTRSHSSSS